MSLPRGSVSHCRSEEFMVEAYVKGARCGNAQHAELEGSTAVFSRRRFRDKWNRTIVRRLARTRNHTARVKARVRARGVTGQQFFNDRQDDGPRLQLSLVHPHSSLAQRLSPTFGFCVRELDVRSFVVPRPGRSRSGRFSWRETGTLSTRQRCRAKLPIT